MSRVSITLLDGSDPLTVELAKRHAAEWGCLYTDWDSAKALAEFRMQKTDGSLPTTLVLREDGQVAGSVSLLYGDCEARMDLDPWLGSLYVFPEFRGRGYAGRLIDAAIQAASAAGKKALHVFTESAAELFRRHGFETVERAMLHGKPVEILRRALP
jgi:N-acetylglutamate synthase-like GNAT family acetyltransferase